MQGKTRNNAKNVVSVANYKPATWFIAFMMLIGQSFLGTATVFNHNYAHAVIETTYTYRS